MSTKTARTFDTDAIFKADSLDKVHQLVEKAISDRLKDEEINSRHDYYERRRDLRERGSRLVEMWVDANAETDTLGGSQPSPNETATCTKCEKTTPASQWEEVGPSLTENGSTRMIAVMARCPECGHHQ